MHYAASSNINIQLPPSMGFAKTGVSEEQIKKDIEFTIRNSSKWINNSNMTGAVLHADFGGTAGLQPIENADGQRIEYYFLKQTNQDPLIKDTASVYPVTGDVLPLLPDPPSDDYFQYDEFLIDEEIDQGKKKSKFSLGDVLISPAMAGDMIEPNVLTAEVEDYVSIIKGYESLGEKIIVDGVVKYKNYKGKGEEKITSGYGSYRDENKLEDSVTEAEANAQLVKDINDRLPKVKKNIKNFDKFPLDVRQHLVSSWFRGSLSGSPLTIRLINAGKFKEASIEFLKNEEYDNAISLDRRGIIKRMKNTAKAIKSLSK